VLRVGLTGGIACGKSHVLRRLAEHGFQTLDLDAVAREVTVPGTPALAEVAAAFGARVVGSDGSLDRAALAALVFADPGARGRLNAIVHPRVRAAEARWAGAFAERPDAVLVTDGALLVEAGAHLRFDRLVVVHCEAEQQVSRLRARDGLDERSARARIEAQMPLAEKRAFAHFEVDTSGSIADTGRAADALALELAGLVQKRPRVPRVDVDTLMGGLLHGPETGPRGLSPLALLATVAAGGGLELEALAARLTPPAGRPWYRTAAEAEPAAAATSLSVALAAWALRRGAPDPQFLAAAAGSVARLTHADPAARADACLLSLVAQETALDPRRSEDIEGRAEGLSQLAWRFGGAPPSGRLRPVLAAVHLRPHDPEGARVECARRGGDPDLAGALAGLASPFEPSPHAVGLRSALEAIAAVRR
jgi:dephospho-CoA kinase